MENMLKPLTAEKSAALHGDISVPGDKSISHRALMLASQAIGTTSITGLLEGEDVLHTAEALRKLGVVITRHSDSEYSVEGVGTGGLLASDDVLDMGNSGTGVRLLMGLVSSYPFTTFFTGDDSLRKRPMKRVIAPLQQNGMQLLSHNDYRLPLSIQGIQLPMPITYTLPVASAQVKSAILLSALNIAGDTTVIEPHPTRDHTENMLRYLGADVTIQDLDEGRHITLKGQPELTAKDIDVPADPSSAAFPIVAALITPEASVTVRNVCMNPLRSGLYDVLIEMGAAITFDNQREEAGEPVADITASYSKLKGIDVPAWRAPSMIDEYPILAVAAAYAEGNTHMAGLEELKVKESNRLQAIADGLAANGVTHEMGESHLTVTGGMVPGGGTVATHLDHRIAMSFLVMGLQSEKPVTVDDSRMIATSFPDFIPLMQDLGAQFRA